MISSTKPEVHNISQSRWRRTKPRPQTTCRNNLVKVACVVMEVSLRTGRHTYTHKHRRTHHNTLQLLPWAK